jgi:hypothetical protein
MLAEVAFSPPVVSAAERASQVRRALAAQIRTHGINRDGARVIVVARYKEDSSWVDTYFMDVPHVVITPGLPGATYTTAKNKGNEAGPFLTYIIENYDRLPAHMAFVHGHRVSHHTYQLDIVPALKAVRWGSRPYIPLNVHMYQRVNADKPEYEDMAKVWGRLFTDLAPTIPKEFLSWCCAQFVVTRAAVRARPKAFYVNLLDWVTNEGPWRAEKNVTSYISSRVLEQTWHMIFGMPALSDLIPPCDLFDCDVLDTVTAQVEQWEGTPFDRIPCKLYELKHIENRRRRVTPTFEPKAVLARAATDAEAPLIERETRAREEALEAVKDSDAGDRARGDLRLDIKDENTDVAKLQFGFGRPDDPGIAAAPWKP